MATRPIVISWELLLALCQPGSTVTWQAEPDKEAVCVSGVSLDSTLERVIVGPDRTITLMVNDPQFEGESELTPLWQKRSKA